MGTRVTRWLRGLSVLQRLAWMVLALALVNLLLRIVSASRPAAHAVLVVLALIPVLASHWRSLLWRVRTRLLVSYFLFGVVPVVLMGLMMVFMGAYLLGLFAADRVREALERQVDAVGWAAHELGDLAQRAGSDSLPLEWSGRVADLRQRIPRLAAVVRLGDQVTVFPDAADPVVVPGGIEPGFKGVVAADGRGFIVAHIRTGEPMAEAFAYVPLDGETLAALTPTVPFVGIVVGDANVNVNFGSGSITIDRDALQTQITSAVVTGVVPPARGFWDRMIPWLLPWPDRVTPDGKETGEIAFTLVSRTSLLVPSLLKTSGPVAGVFALLMVIVVMVLLVVEAAALAWSLTLTRTITRSVHDLYEGTREVAAGNLAHKTPVRRRDQLGELASSFNGMTDRIQQLIVEVRKKEKLEAELEIARRVQTELFPKTVPALETLELAGLCVPSRFVSGDYYDFVPLAGRWTALALGDISGKGISAALLMASLQSALHAQLRFAGAASAVDGGTPQTSTLVARLSEQLYEHTPPEKYATFFCSVYDDRTGRLVYTNAGHLPPLLVRGGQATALGVSGMVVGLLPMFSYEQQTIDLQPGDLLAAFTDGVTEAENAEAEQFGEARLTELLIRHAREPLDDIIRIVIDRVREWTHDLEGRDDTTILLARRR